METLRLAKLGEPVLRRKATEVSGGDLSSGQIQGLIDRMVETMRAEGGVGLAAPQVFESKRIAVLENDIEGPEAFGLIVMVNPVITHRSEEKAESWEGCLSIDNLRGLVPRHQEVWVEYLDREGAKHTLRTGGFRAIVVQHECDHLDGILFLDRMEDLTSLCHMELFEKYVLKRESAEVAPV
jgi:peptide deformylase